MISWEVSWSNGTKDHCAFDRDIPQEGLGPNALKLPIVPGRSVKISRRVIDGRKIGFKTIRYLLQPFAPVAGIFNRPPRIFLPQIRGITGDYP
jgi:hypothetical protein